MKVATELTEQTASGRLFQTEGVQEQNDLAPALILTLGTDRLIPLFDLSERDGVKISSLFFTKCFQSYGIIILISI